MFLHPFLVWKTIPQRPTARYRHKRSVPFQSYPAQPAVLRLWSRAPLRPPIACPSRLPCEHPLKQAAPMPTPQGLRE